MEKGQMLIAIAYFEGIFLLTSFNSKRSRRSGFDRTVTPPPPKKDL
jgi:hypothetical protein